MNKPDAAPDDARTQSSHAMEEDAQPELAPTPPMQSDRAESASSGAGSVGGKKRRPRPVRKEPEKYDNKTTPVGAVSGRSTPTGLGATPLTLPLAEGGLVAGKYRLLEKLGEGGFGEVWKAERTDLGTFHAIKVLAISTTIDGEFAIRFKREAKLMFDLKDEPNAVRINDYDMGPPPYIIMEYVPGQTMRRMLLKDPTETGGKRTQSPLPLPLIARFLEQLCGVLEAARAIGLVHRDLKPENVMILPDSQPGAERIKVLDLGIAKIVGDSETSREGDSGFHHTQPQKLPLCTPAYASPEQADQEPNIDHRSDLYSLGVILFELLTGRTPFEMDLTKKGLDRAMTLLQQHMNATPPSLSSVAPPGTRIPPGIERLVLKCLEKDPANRPQTAAEIWATFAGEIGIELPGTGHSPKKKAPDRSLATNSVKWFLPALVVIGLIGGIAVYRGLEPHETNQKDKLGETPLTNDGGTGTTPVTPIVPKPDFTSRIVRKGFEVEPGSIYLDGWPVSISKKIDKKYVLKFRHYQNGRYLPDGYQPVEADGESNGWPKRIRRIGENDMGLVLIPGGTFSMGYNYEGKGDRLPYHPAHPVTLSPFYMQETEVTIGQFEDNMESIWAEDKVKLEGIRKVVDDLKAYIKEDDKYDPMKFKISQFPITRLTWDEARSFALALGGDLPTEAQFEFAARSGDSKPDHPEWFLGKHKTLDWVLHPDQEMHPYFIEESSFTKPVKGSQVFDMTDDGIFDLGANAPEWCRDRFDNYDNDEKVVQSDPCKDVGEPHVIRGAVNSLDIAVYERNVPLRNDKKDPTSKELSKQFVGFRMVLELKGLDFNDSGN